MINTMVALLATIDVANVVIVNFVRAIVAFECVWNRLSHFQARLQLIVGVAIFIMHMWCLKKWCTKYLCQEHACMALLNWQEKNCGGMELSFKWIYCWSYEAHCVRCLECTWNNASSLQGMWCEEWVTLGVNVGKMCFKVCKWHGDGKLIALLLYMQGRF